MCDSIDMPGSIDLVPVNSTPAVLQETRNSSIPKERARKFQPTGVSLVILAVVLFFAIFVSNIAFLIYLNSRLNAELGSYNQRLDESTNKLAEFETQMQHVSKQIENYVRKNSSNPLPLVGETLVYERHSLKKLEEYPAIQEVDEQGLLSLNASSDKKTSRSGAPPPLMSDGDDKSTSEETENEDDEEEEIEAFNGRSDKLPPYRRRRHAEVTDGSGGGNSIATSQAPLDRRNKSSKADSSKADFSKADFVNPNFLQNFTTSLTDTRTQCNCTPSEDADKMQNQQKLANRRSISPKKTPTARAISSREVAEESSEIVAAHFGADSSKYNKQTHPHYYGNYHLRHPTGEYEDWKPSAWFDELSMDKHFTLSSNNIIVHTPGLYFVYVQIFYSDLNDANGYMVYLNSQVVLQCITTAYSPNTLTLKSNTCYTGGVVRCQADDKISVKTVDKNKRVMLEASRSFVGMFKIGEFQSVK